MRTLLQYLAAAAVVALPMEAGAAPLWQNTESGMSAAKVRDLFPTASTPSKVDTLHGGARCELAIQDYEIATTTYEVCFFFKSGGLVQVMLSAKEANQPRFRSVVDLLRGKYGPEIGAGQPICEPGRIMTKCDANWVLKSGTNISATYLEIGASDPDPVLNINYQTRMAQDASKL